MEQIGIFAVPVTIVLIVIVGAFRKVALLECFTQGVREGANSLLSVAPSLFGLVVGVSMLSASGFFEMMASCLSPVMGWLGIPAEVVPLGLMRPVTGSGSLAILNDILELNGPDSEAGRIASVMAGSTETTFYAIAVYYGAVGLKKTRFTLPAALLADMAGMMLAVMTVKWL